MIVKGRGHPVFPSFFVAHPESTWQGFRGLRGLSILPAPARAWNLLGRETKEPLRSAEQACRVASPLRARRRVVYANSTLQHFLPKPLTLGTADEGVLQANTALSSFASLALTPRGLDAHEDVKERLDQEELRKPCRKMRHHYSLTLCRSALVPS